MTIGTRSVLYGAHQFLLHPWFVAAAWWRLYGFPWDPRLWVAFFVHDLGYIGKPNMDGPEGEQHPMLGAAIMWRCFDVNDASMEDDEDCTTGVQYRWRVLARVCNAVFGDGLAITGQEHTWAGFVKYHSRFVAKADGTCPSRLCVADKLAISLTPAWLYLPMARATGELAEYRAHHDAAKNGAGKYAGDKHTRSDFATSDAGWYARVQDYCSRWAYAHRDGGDDTWTGAAKPEVRS